MLHAVRGQVWFTETGGIVARHNRHKVTFPESARHAAVATRFVFRRLVPISHRVTRVYIYQWNAGPPPQTWDSGLVGPTGRARPALRVVTRVLRRQRARRTAGATGGTVPLPPPLAPQLRTGASGLENQRSANGSSLNGATSA